MSVKKRVYFIRHGQSKGNINKVFQNTDDPLTELGRIQALSVAKKTASFKAEVVLSSPLSRALETAKAIVNETGLPLETNELLREYSSPSKLCDQPLHSPESEVFYRQMLEHLDDPSWHYDDEDNYHDLYNRASTLLDHLVEREEKTIIAVTHGAFMRILLATMMTEGRPDAITAVRLVRFLSQKNTGITSCEYNLDTVNGNSWRLVAWNDYAHLDGGGLYNTVTL
jgi:broad specificity phosphatase PhoE